MDPSPSPTMNDMLQLGFWQTQVLGYLDHRDALRFSSISRAARATGVRALPCPVNERRGGWDGDWGDGISRKWQDLALLAPTSISHSVVIQATWNDQGWGNQKGRLYVIRQGGTGPNDFQAWPESVVTGTRHDAPHRPENVQLVFRPAFEQAYELWHKEGGGGGHSLTVSNLTVKQVVYSHSNTSTASSRRFLLPT